MDYGIIFKNVPLMCDNESMVKLATNPVQHSRTKHIDIRHHFLRDCNALNLGVEFFSSFHSPNSGVTLFSLSVSLPSSQFQTSIVTGVRVMYKQNLSVMGVASCRSAFLCLMSRVRLVPSRISVRDGSPFNGRACRGFRSAM
jgi:hypothetical protein